MTSKGTQQEDHIFKHRLYTQIGVEEYWLFDPKGEWLESPLMGYRLAGDDYVPITDNCSQALGFRLNVEGKLIEFTSLATGEQLLAPAELSHELVQEQHRAERLREQLRALGVDPVA